MKNKLFGLPDYNLNITEYCAFFNFITEVSFTTKHKTAQLHGFDDFFASSFGMLS